MRLSLLSLAICLVPACATPSRARSPDTGHALADTGTHLDAGMAIDMGAAHDAGGTTQEDMGTSVMMDMGVVNTLDMGGIVRIDAFVPTLDSGSDAGPRPDTGCSNDSQCSDGLVCNGTERCVSGACVASTTSMCDDGRACTTDSCAEPGTCTNVSTCASGMSCGATGCTSSCSDTPCRLVSPQCGCPTGQACYPNGATRACAASGTGTAGSSCTTNSSCAASYACLNISSGTTAVNVCTHMCSVDGDCGGGLCLYQLDDGTGMPVPNLTLCSHPCNAATQAGCGTGSACTLFHETAGAMRWFTDCEAPAGTHGEDASCLNESDCSAGRVCIDAGDGLGNACHHWCNFTTGAGCTGGRVCNGFMTPVVVNSITYGVCSF